MTAVPSVAKKKTVMPNERLVPVAKTLRHQSLVLILRQESTNPTASQADVPLLIPIVPKHPKVTRKQPIVKIVAVALQASLVPK